MTWVLRTLIVMMLLTAACTQKRSPEVTTEVERREAFALELLRDAGAPALRLSSTEDISFKEGFSIVQLEPWEKFDGAAFRWMGGRAHIRLRVRDPKATMRLRFVGWVVQQVVHTRPRIFIYVDGQYLGTTQPIDEKGFFFSDTGIDPVYLRGREWIDLTLEPSSVGFHWLEVSDLRYVKLVDFEWSRAPGN